ncbi:putative bacterial extracellular solute-binding protein [Waddlia chondrophila 2032/99]|uniref:Putative bacterial extracellular solute-binding protein n=2 Tax=Waddlia chondrophila TaxID=71667 RepID=D6YU42_WADCW|nr:ABC transporter substrate-binding protein [Waddlia chondrophila]ADI37653.1 putative bacterial extracellular solute-binding protein [Waddlia chondrophila WSU 86-1044]CCB90600.1 putative bacterial extracellular solute-binding protein [Waddlia chondrophila 2032/99]
MSSINRKLVISITSGLFVAVALIWLILRVFSGGYTPTVPIYYIARDSTWYPADLRGKEKNMVGFANDLIQEIADMQGFRVQVFEVGRNGLYDGLDTGRYEGVFSTLEPNPVNRKKYLFSDPFYRLGPVLIVRENSKIASLEDLNGKILGIESGALQTFDLSEPPKVVMIPYDSSSTALERLNANVIDAVIMDVLRAYVFTGGFYSGRLKIATSPLTDRGLRLLTRNQPNFHLLISQFNEGLHRLQESGRYGELLDKWELIHTELVQELPDHTS